MLETLIHIENKNAQTVQMITGFLVSALVVLVPLFFLTTTTDVFFINKQLLLVGATGILLILWVLERIFARKFIFRQTTFGLPVLAFFFASLASLLFASSNKIEALLNPLGVGSIITLTVLYFIVTHALSKKSISWTAPAFVLSGSLLSLFTVIHYTGALNPFISIEFIKNPAFSPTGSLLTTVLYLIVILPFLVQLAQHAFKSKNPVGQILYGLAVVIIIGGIGVSGYQLATSAKPQLMPIGAAWTVTSEALKNKPLFGVGAENYLTAFTIGRPAVLNISPVWNIRFITSSNIYFHILTTLGLFGFGALLFWTIKTGLTMKKSGMIHTPTLLVQTLTFVVLLVFPPSLVLLFVLYVSAALFDATLENHTTISLPKNTYLYGLLLGIPLILCAVSFYFTGRAYAASVQFKKSFDALSQNDGVSVYNRQIQAIQLNPYFSPFHIGYAQTNLALANALSQKKDITDAEREQITQLIQQSIREARNGVILNRSSIVAWENLATIYRSLINFAEGSDQWAVAGFQQAVALDPTNPVLRISLGNTYYTIGNFDESIRQFEIATHLKPDYANSWYNLAISYRDNKQYEKAKAAMQKVLGIVPADSNDYKTAEKQLQEIEQLVAKTAPAEPKGQPETLTQPEPKQQQITPPIQLPGEEVAPPTEAENVDGANLEPSPLPSATPLPTVAPTPAQ